MSNSPLISYTKISPNKTSPRNHKIDTVTIHCYVAQASVESMGAWFAEKSARCSCNYSIGTDGRIALIVDEADRSWCTSSASNDNRAITIECASDKTHPYAVNDKVYKSLIKLLADICKRNDIKELKWKNDKSLIGQVDKQNMTLHRWYANKECPGQYLYERHGQIAKEVNALLGVNSESDSDEIVYRVRKSWSDISSQKGAFVKLNNAKACADENPGYSVYDTNGTEVYKGNISVSGFQAKDLKGLSESEVVKKVGPLFTKDHKKTGILASVSMAQFILESGYASTDLAQNANNCFGMKESLSGNTWPGSTWDGTSTYTKITKECYDGKTYVDVKAKFRKYSCVEDSIGDHSAYLLGATNGQKKRYEGLKGCSDYRKAIQIIKNGGYATDPKYIDKICNIISKWNLTKYDVVTKKEETKVESSKPTNVFKPYKVKVNIPHLNIRTGAGTNYAKTGEYTGVGIFTIIEEKTGPGSDSGWGRLKSGAGWISLDYATRI